MSEPDSLGPALRAARDTRDLSVPQVAEYLKVPPRVVEKIEAEDFDALPARVFTRAYIRRYAELVGLEPNAILFAYDQQTDADGTPEIEAQPRVTFPRIRTAFREGRQLPQRQSWVFGGTVFLITALVGVFLWFALPSETPVAPAPAGQSDQASSEDAGQPVSSEDRLAFETSDPPTPAPARPDASTPFADAPLDTTADGSIAPSETPMPDDVPAIVSIDMPHGSPGGSPNGSPMSLPEGEEQVAYSNPLTYAPGEDHVLAFRFTHDCWVVVLDGSGEMLHQDLERADDYLEVRGEVPFTITLGYAPGVRLEYNGESVALAQHTSDSGVAQLVLGL